MKSKQITIEFKRNEQTLLDLLELTDGIAQEEEVREKVDELKDMLYQRIYGDSLQGVEQDECKAYYVYNCHSAE